MEEEKKMKCPLCGHDDLYIHTRGFNVIQGIIVSVLILLFFIIVDYGITENLNTISLIAYLAVGTAGQFGRDKLVFRCLHCNNKYKFEDVFNARKGVNIKE